MTNTIDIRREGRLAYDEYNCTPPWTRPATVVLVHGFTKNRRFFYDWIPELAKSYRVICVDQRGHGDSSPLPANFTMAIRDFSDDLADFANKLGLIHAHYVMAEFTSCIALDFAIAYPELIGSLVLPGVVFKPSAGVDWEGWAKIVDAQGSQAWAQATNDHRLPADVDPAKREWYVTQQGRFPPGPLAAFFRWTCTQDFSGNFARIQAPTLLMTGQHARVQPVPEVLAAAATMPRAVVKVFEGMPLNVMSAAPHDCVRETLQFLETVDKPDPYARVRGAAVRQ